MVEFLPRGDVIAFVMGSIKQVMLCPPMAGHHSDRKEVFQNNCLSSVERLVNTVPTQILKISLEGRFWEEITKIFQTPEESLRSSTMLETSLYTGTLGKIFNDQSVPIVYSGSSMNPTFWDADLLEVTSNMTRKYLVGDVICFKSSLKDSYIIHRIISIHKTGYLTRGDNNPIPDPELVQPDKIIGLVVAVSRASGSRKVIGGRLGMTLHRLLQMRKMILMKIDLLITNKKPIRFGIFLIRHYFSYFLKPRYVLFSTKNSRFIRIYFGNHIGGDYNTIRKTWIIRFPFSLIINKDTLPVIEEPLFRDQTSEGTQ